MNWTALLLVATKYLPALINMIQQDAPTVQAFIKDVEAALQAGPTPIALPDLGAQLGQLLANVKAGNVNVAGPPISSSPKFTS
jgi:uncharacterized membrane-anchored protein